MEIVVGPVVFVQICSAQRASSMEQFSMEIKH